MHKRSEMSASDADRRSMNSSYIALLNDALKFKCKHPIRCSHIACENDCKTLNRKLTWGYRVSSCQFRTYQRNNNLIEKSGHVISKRGYCTVSIGGSPGVIRKSDTEHAFNRYDGCLIMH